MRHFAKLPEKHFASIGICDFDVFCVWRFHVGIGIHIDVAAWHKRNHNEQHKPIGNRTIGNSIIVDDFDFLFSLFIDDVVCIDVGLFFLPQYLDKLAIEIKSMVQGVAPYPCPIFKCIH